MIERMPYDGGMIYPFAIVTSTCNVIWSMASVVQV